MLFSTLLLGSVLALPVVPSADAEGLFFGDGTERFGFQLAHGDLDADGHLDLVVGAPDPSAGNRVYVFFGPIELAAHPQLGPADADLIIEGPQGSEAGWSIAVGDVLGSGDDDLIVGAPGEAAGRGRVHVFAGPLQPATLPLGASDHAVEGTSAGDYLGWSVAAGDFDGDGRDELAAGACGLDRGWALTAGSAYLFDLDVASPATAAANATATFLGVGRTGCAMSSGGDFNGDGFEDLLIGSYGAYQTTSFEEGGSVALVYGRSAFAATYDLWYGDPVAMDMADLTAQSQGANLGFDVAPAGDVNHDGYDDLILGAPAYDCRDCTFPVTDKTGRAYLVLGTADLGPGGGASRGLAGRSRIDEVAALIYENPDADDGTGFSVGAAGFAGPTYSRVNHPLQPQPQYGEVLLIGSRSDRAWAMAYDLSPSYRGVAYECDLDPDGRLTCVIDAPAPPIQRIDLGQALIGGHELQGAPDEVFGLEVLGGDFDGDGWGDLLIGAPNQLDFEDPAGEGVAYGFQGR